ncbi:MAG TPA: hypothetical protein VGI30_03475 [Caulobacteraceae bacterium]|jgi:hypothetical protein
MTSFYPPETNEDFLRKFRRSSRDKRIRSYFPMVAMIHFSILAGVAAYCLNLAR